MGVIITTFLISCHFKMYPHLLESAYMLFYSDVRYYLSLFVRSVQVGEHKGFVLWGMRKRAVQK